MQVQFYRYFITVKTGRSLLASAAKRIVGPAAAASMAQPQQFHHQHFLLVRRRRCMISRRSASIFASLRLIVKNILIFTERFLPLFTFE
jgi:hypothetical protein